MQQNEAASRSYCLATLEKLAEPLRESISRRDFSVPDGHRLYLEARKKIEQDYEQVSRKGVKVRNEGRYVVHSMSTTTAVAAAPGI